jgi:hypothetical protein
MNPAPVPTASGSRVSRRSFLGGCAACAARVACQAATVSALIPSIASASQPSPASTEKVKVRLVFSHIPADKPTWPYEGFDYEGRKKELTQRLSSACPGIEFLPTTAMNANDARSILLKDSEVDGYVVYMLGLWPRAGDVIAASNRPTIFVDDLYAGSGEFLISYAAAKRKGLRTAGVSSSRFEDVVQAVKTFDTIKKLRSAVILDVVDRNPGTNASAITDVFGTSVRPISSAEYNEAYQKADRAEGVEWARRWIKGAQKVIEPTTEEIENSGRIFIGIRNLMDQYKSDAITVDCLGLFYGGKAPAYPCLGFFQLNNDGKVGACEADLQSTITMLAITYLTGRPGYISDPVIDTSRNQIIYAHCVAPSRVFGPTGPASTYYIRSHSEDRKGASVRVLMPVNEMTTTLRINSATRQVIFHQAKAVTNIDEDKACRTKLAAEIRDPYKMMEEYDRWGWHRVTFYGDLRVPVHTLSSLLGLTVVNEG